MVTKLDGTPQRADQHVGAQVRHRRHAALRLPPLPGTGLRDPLLEQLERPREPSTFGLTDRELTCEARRLLSLGWEPWEIESTLLLPHLKDAR